MPVTARYGTPNIANKIASYHVGGLGSLLVNWKDWEPSKGSFSSTVEGQLDESFQAAHDHGSCLLFRLMCGHMSPAWLRTHATRPVTWLDVVSGDPNNPGGHEYFPLPWSNNLRLHYRDFLRNCVGPYLAGTCPGGGHNRLTHVHNFTLSLPTLAGSEMQSGYGSGAARTYNLNAWAAADPDTPLAGRPAKLRQAWDNNVTDCDELLGTDIRLSAALGRLLENWTETRQFVTNHASMGRRLIVLFTNLDSTYANCQAVEQRATLQQAANAGNAVAMQTRTLALQPFNQGFVDGVEHILNGFKRSGSCSANDYDGGVGIEFIEVQASALSNPPSATIAPTGGWTQTAGSYTSRQYLQTAATSVESRTLACSGGGGTIPPPPRRTRR
jgi:hypothetical protein